MRRRVWLAAIAAILAFGFWQTGQAAYIHAKAALAQVLLDRAWTATLAGGARVRPWPWADTWPVARLQVPALGVDQFVLAGASGRNLAFGPGHLDSTALPGAPGHSILGGHRDTHFAFLQNLAPGWDLRIQKPDGQWQSYEVIASDVIDSRKARLHQDRDTTAITLVTCFPFDAITPGGPLRYLVFAEAAFSQSANANRSQRQAPAQDRLTSIRSDRRSDAVSLHARD